MKNKTLRILSLGLATTTTLSTSTPVFAYDVDEHDNSIESVEYQNTEDEDFDNATNVFAQIGSEYKVTIPKVVVLSGVSKAASYYVKVEGDIAGYEKINVVPEDSFKLSAKNKADETATINQDKTTWTVHDFDTDANGQISAENITAGKWTGAFNFNINLESDDISTSPEEKVLGDLIIPDVNEWNGQVLSDIYVMEIGDIDSLKVTNNSKDVSDALEITSSNEDVVKVEDKQLEAVGTGQTTITTIYESKSLSAKIKVVKPKTPAHTHITASPVKENEVASTCAKEGSYDEVIYCASCGEEISRTTKTINKLAHKPASIVKENEVAATYEKEGSYDEVTYCADCGEELSRVTKTIPKLIVAGLYDENDNLIKSWDELVALGLDIEKDYDRKLKTKATSVRSVFENNNLSGKLVIPNSVTKIGDYAFNSCKSLTSVVIPSSVTSIGAFAFYNCTSLTSIIVDDTNQYYCSIDGILFTKDMKKLVWYPQGKTDISYIIPNSVTSISMGAFNGCKSLTSVVIPSSVTSIGIAAFDDCTSLKSVTIPTSITSISSNVFYGCKSLESITIPDSVTSIDDSAFAFAGLTSVIIPDSVTNIGDYAFYHCTKLTSITIPDSVTSIGRDAFWSCTSLESVTLPNSITSIGNSAFESCKSLTQVTIPDSVTSIGKDAFIYCSKLTSVTYRGVTYTDKNAFNDKLKSDGVATNNVWI